MCPHSCLLMIKLEWFMFCLFFYWLWRSLTRGIIIQNDEPRVYILPYLAIKRISIFYTLTAHCHVCLIRFARQKVWKWPYDFCSFNLKFPSLFSLWVFMVVSILEKSFLFSSLILTITVPLIVPKWIYIFRFCVDFSIPLKKWLFAFKWPTFAFHFSFKELFLNLRGRRRCFFCPCSHLNKYDMMIRWSVWERELSVR